MADVSDNSVALALAEFTPNNVRLELWSVHLKCLCSHSLINPVCMC